MRAGVVLNVAGRALNLFDLRLKLIHVVEQLLTLRGNGHSQLPYRGAAPNRRADTPRVVL
jgi:hypothetical protein